MPTRERRAQELCPRCHTCGQRTHPVSTGEYAGLVRVEFHCGQPGHNTYVRVLTDAQERILAALYANE